MSSETPVQKMVRAFSTRAHERDEKADELTQRARVARKEAKAYRELVEGLKNSDLSPNAARALYEEIK